MHTVTRSYRPTIARRRPMHRPSHQHTHGRLRCGHTNTQYVHMFIIFCPHPVSVTHSRPKEIIDGASGLTQMHRSTSQSRSRSSMRTPVRGSARARAQCLPRRLGLHLPRCVKQLLGGARDLRDILRGSFIKRRGERRGGTESEDSGLATTRPRELQSFWRTACGPVS